MSPEQSNQSQELPIDAVLSMRQDGYDNNQIIQQLQGQGYSSSTIFDALNQADMREIGDEEEATSKMATAKNQQQAQPSPASQTQASQEELIEELVEEKWHELTDNLQVVIDWKEKSERRLQDVEDDIKSLKDSVDQIQSSIGEKLNDYDTTMKDVKSDVNAMEKTFSDALPAFTENVSELRSLVEAMRDEADGISSDSHTTSTTTPRSASEKDESS